MPNKEKIKFLFYGIMASLCLLSPYAFLQVIFLVPLNFYLKRKTTMTNKEREIVIFFLFITTAITWVSAKIFAHFIHGYKYKIYLFY